MTSLSVRTVREDDRRRLLEWRNSDRVRRMSIDDRPIDESAHAEWFDRLRPETLLIVEERARPVGVVRVTDLDSAERSCSWSCHLGETDVAPGVGACLPVLGLGLGFETWGADTMTAEVLESNRNMLGVHRRLGIPRAGVQHTQVARADGTVCDLVGFVVTRAQWPSVRTKCATLLPSALADSVERLLHDLTAAPAIFDRG